MEEDKITVICPQCRKKTRIPNAGVPTRTVKCGHCQFKGPLMLFQIEVPKPAASNSIQRGTPTVIDSTSYSQTSSKTNSGATVIEQRSNANGGIAIEKNGETMVESPQVVMPPSIGYFQIVSTGQKYALKQGTNIIGRQHPTSQATIQIATNDGYMSRQHMKIDVLPAGNHMEYRISDNNSTNKVTLNGRQLTPGDIVMLRSGDRITIGHTDLLFTI